MDPYTDAAATGPTSTPASRLHVARRRRIPGDGPARSTPVTLLDLPWPEDAEPRLVRAGGRLRLVADVGASGVDVALPYPGATATGLRPGRAGRHRWVAGLAGFRPPGVDTTCTPSPVAPAHRRPGDDEVSRIVFATDDRFAFQDTSYPWRVTGRVRTAGGWGAGATVGRRHVLTSTAAVDWSRDAAGRIGWATFTPGCADGRGPWGEAVVDEVLRWVPDPPVAAGRPPEPDVVVLVLREAVGDTIGFAGVRTYETAWNGGDFWQDVGYCADVAGGECPAYRGGVVVSGRTDVPLGSGAAALSASVLRSYPEVPPGRSGGVVWGWFGHEPWPSVIGVRGTTGSTRLQEPGGDGGLRGGPALAALVSWARHHRP